MRNKILPAIFLICLWAIFNKINAQQEMITIDKPFIAKNLSGKIVDITNSAIPDATITRFADDWKTEIESIETDVNGKFAFRKVPLGIYYLRISRKYFNDLQVKVDLKKSSKSKLKFQLNVSN